MAMKGCFAFPKFLHYWNLTIRLLRVISRTHVGKCLTPLQRCSRCNKRVIKGPGRFGSWRPRGHHPNNSIIENGQNTEESPGDLRRFALTKSPVKDHQLTQMWKTLMSNNNDKFTKWQEKINHVIYRDVIKLFAKMKKIDTLIHIIRLYSQNRIWHRKCAILIMRNGKRQKTEGTELPYYEKIRDNENYMYLRILEVYFIKQVEMKEKIKTSMLDKEKNFSKANSATEISAKG